MRPRSLFHGLPVLAQCHVDDKRGGRKGGREGGRGKGEREGSAPHTVLLFACRQFAVAGFIGDRAVEDSACSPPIVSIAAGAHTATLD